MFESPTETRPPTVGRYDVVAALGKGGMATVVKAFDHVRRESVAMKRLAPGGDAHGFEREFRALKSLDHPRIIRVFDYGVDDHGPFYTMELLDGADLLQPEPVDWRATCQYLRDVATCLSLLHARRLIHRDVSARNVRVSADGRCKLIDFGALVDFGPIDSIVGTAPYIAPETLRVRHLDQRADLFSLGALAYRCLTGESAYPASNIAGLPEMWRRSPRPPSERVHGVPPWLDDLVMGLLEQNPLGRPSSAAEVIARLDAALELRGDDEGEQRSLAQSFLSCPGFVGRKDELRQLEDALHVAVAASGQALRIVGPAGSGRTRLLDEVAVRGQLAGATVLRADASVQGVRNGTLRELLQELGNSRPPVAEQPRDRSRKVRTAPRRDRQQATSRGTDPVEQLLAASHSQPLVLLVDNVELADTASIASLVDLARAVDRAPILLVVTESSESGAAHAPGLGSLMAACRTVPLAHLTADEMLSLLRAIFGDAPRIERLSEWLHAESGGSPLHAIEIARYLVSQGVIRHQRGAWLLPQDRPALLVSNALGNALRGRMDGLSSEARFLLESLALQELEPSLELCELLVEGHGSGAGVWELLDELVAANLLHMTGPHYQFTSLAARQTAISQLTSTERRAAHRALGHALLRLQGDATMLQLQAGWHFIRGGDEMFGARMIAQAAERSTWIALLLVNLYPAADPVEAALMVYRRHRVPARQRLPLLSALAQAGYYSHYSWADRYGDVALDAAEQASGLAAARRYRRWIGGHLGLWLALTLACIRHYLLPKEVRGGSFRALLTQACSTVCALTGVATITLDSERAARVAATLEPLKVLPERCSPRVAQRICEGLTLLPQENPVEGFKTFDRLTQQLQTPGHIWLTPEGVHDMYVGACHFARGVFAVMRSGSEAALQSAARLEETGLPLYVMIACELRHLYFLNRGEIELARAHREQVELHAARVGSAWQVELWEAFSIVPLQVITNDLVGLKGIAHRLDELSNVMPSMHKYAELARVAPRYTERELHLQVARTVGHLQPRSFVGWTVVQVLEAMGFNHRGEHQAAWEVCARALGRITDADRQYVVLFLPLDIQAAVAEAGLGRVEAALERLDRELERHADTEHAMTMGLLHEARARIAFRAGLRGAYLHSAVEAARWLQPTQHPGLIAMVERLAQLEATEHTRTLLLPSVPTRRPEATGEASTTISAG